MNWTISSSAGKRISLLGAMLCSIPLGGISRADGNLQVVRVVERWELAVGIPNLERNGPQVTMIMSPNGTTSGDYFAFALNLKTSPSYEPGGMQVQHWVGKNQLDFRNGPNHGSLNKIDETVTWEQHLSLEDGTLVFEIQNGTSDSWGTFGGQGYLTYSIPTSLTSLNAYHPSVSINESGVGFAGNRVVSLILQRLEWHLADGRVFAMNAPIDIDGDLDPWN